MKKLFVSGLLQDLVVRLCFVLGNLTAKNEQARLRLFEENEGLDTLLAVLKTYDELDAQVINHISVSLLLRGYHFLFQLAKTFTAVLMFMNKVMLVDLVCHHTCSIIVWLQSNYSRYAEKLPMKLFNMWGWKSETQHRCISRLIIITVCLAVCLIR